MVRAHAGGIDEMLLLAGPLLMFTLCRWLARGRTTAQAAPQRRGKPRKRRR